MKFRKQGRYVYAVKGSHIVWTSKPPAKGTEVYVVGWGNGQQSLLASKIITQE
jgi:hypothetical protein